MKIHLLGIGGTGMGALAGLLKEKGHEVTGSDLKLYPPMSDVLDDLEISVFEEYDPYRVEAVDPDLVIVGNVIRSDNPEVQKVLEENIRAMSFPQALREFFIRDRESLVVAGTHGKTTTTSLLAWVLEVAGKEPSYFIGGVPGNFSHGFCDSKGKHVVLEGDEYDTVFWEKEPKFIHYNPKQVIWTSSEFDHADIYDDLEDVENAFRKLLDRIDPAGNLIACSDYESVRRLISEKKRSFSIFTYGFDPTGQPDFLVEARGRAGFRILRRGSSGAANYEPVEDRYEKNSFPYPGAHHALNACAVWILSTKILGLKEEVIQEAFRSFKGVKRRQEVIFEDDSFILIDDFAHHPTAVGITLQGIKQKYPDRRLWAIWEPRSATSRRKVFQDAYEKAFESADRITIAKPFDQSRIKEEDRFSSEILVKRLSDQGKEAFLGDNAEKIKRSIEEQCRARDVIVIMSNGGFDGLSHRLKESFSVRTSNPELE
jgi:UDP-N-acetylmuramate: L-alanyl-gamma-D-glutamyl-meso-diaminopimelate ligase